MKSIETTVARARSVALEILSSANSEELTRLLELGLPGGIFSELASKTVAPSLRRKPSFICKHASPAIELSGLRPQIFVNRNLPELDAVSTVAAGIFEMARSIYLQAVAGADPADLEVWISAGLPVQVKEVDRSFLAAYESDKSMLKIDMSGASAALCSFAPLRKLVIQDA